MEYFACHAETGRAAKADVPGGGKIMSEPVAICLVPWNSDTWTEHILDQFAAYTAYPSWRVYISDNSDEPHLKQGNRIDYWWNGGNLGFARAMNRALRICPEDIIVVANCDLDLPQAWLSNLVDAYLSTDFGIIGPRMNVRCQSKGIPVNEGVIEVDECPTSALWITSKSRLYDRVGYYDESLFPIGCADIYMPYLLWKAGGRVGIQTDVFVWHDCCGVAKQNVEPAEYKSMVRDARAKLRAKYGSEIDGGKPSA